MGNAPQLTPILYCGDSRVEHVQSRIHYKMRDYASYRFSAPQSCAINIFFDLAQEFDDSEQLHLLAVLVLRMFFQIEAELYLKNEKGELELKTPPIGLSPRQAPPLRPELWCDRDCCYAPVRGKNSVFLPKDQRILSDEDLLGVLVFHTKDGHQDPHQEGHHILFLEKFANRVGFCLHNKRLAERNARHIIFVRKLAHDIGHNIITPNMQQKLMLNHLQAQIATLGELCEKLPPGEATQEVSRLQRIMKEHTGSIMEHFKYGALFLESLLRQGHFDLGHYVLRCSKLDLCSLVVQPQFERYRSHFKERGIHINGEQPVLPGVPCIVEADLGLISQVLANILSNGTKYCTAPPGGNRAEARCTVTVEKGAFGARDGVRVSVYTTGEHIPAQEADKLFHDNFRASNAGSQLGTGHGLYFAREIVMEHGGRIDYKPEPGGNGFSFLLPLV